MDATRRDALGLGRAIFPRFPQQARGKRQSRKQQVDNRSRCIGHGIAIHTVQRPVHTHVTAKPNPRPGRVAGALRSVIDIR